MCPPAHRSIRCRSRWAQGTCLLPIMTITPWCSIERPGLLARGTRTRKFVTRVQVMLNSAAIARPLRVSEMYRDPCRVDNAGPKVVQLLDRVRDQNANSTSPLNRYIEGWAQTDLEKILDATASSYRFTDPFVGSFDARSLHKYFDLLQDRLSCTGAISRRELAFFLQGPMKLRSHKELQFWREAPRIGLTGVAEIEIGERGVAAERVAYDLNLASDILCRAVVPNVSKQPFVITPKNYLRPLKVLGEHAGAVASGDAP